MGPIYLFNYIIWCQTFIIYSK